MPTTRETLSRLWRALPPLLQAPLTSIEVEDGRLLEHIRRTPAVADPKADAKLVRYHERLTDTLTHGLAHELVERRCFFAAQARALVLTACLAGLLAAVGAYHLGKHRGRLDVTATARTACAVREAHGEVAVARHGALPPFTRR